MVLRIYAPCSAVLTASRCPKVFSKGLLAFEGRQQERAEAALIARLIGAVKVNCKLQTQGERGIRAL